MAKLLLISGSLRGGSTNSATLRTAAALAPDGVEATIYDGMGRLPHFNPDDDPTDGVGLDPEVAALRASLAEVDALLLSTPEYAGALPGSFKNLLDWTVGGGEMDGKPVGFINVAGRGRGEKAHASLEVVLGYVAADLRTGARVPMSHTDVDDAGAIGTPELRAAVGEAFRAFVATL